MYVKILKELKELKELTLLSVKKALTTSDVANLTGLTKAYIYKLVRKREIPFYKSEGGKFIYFNADDVQKWIFAHRYASKAEAEAEQKEIERIYEELKKAKESAVLKK